MRAECVHNQLEEVEVSRPSKQRSFTPSLVPLYEVVVESMEENGVGDRPRGREREELCHDEETSKICVLRTLQNFENTHKYAALVYKKHKQRYAAIISNSFQTKLIHHGVNIYPLI